MKNEIGNSAHETSLANSPMHETIAPCSSLHESDTILFSVHTLLDINKQLEVGKATEPKLFKIFALICAIIIVVYNIVNFLFLQDNVLFLALVSVGPVLVLGVLAFRGNYARVLFSGQRRYKKSGVWPEYQISFAKDWFSNYSVVSGKSYRHSYKEIVQVKETESLLLLICGRTVIVLEKDNSKTLQDFINKRLRSL